MHDVVAAAQVPLREGLWDREIFDAIVRLNRVEPEQFLDVIHVTLQIHPYDIPALERHLELGASVWRATDKGLVRRVDPVTQKAFDNASREQDSASDDLAEAWGQGLRT
jgi:hypothetical protein